MKTWMVLLVLGAPGCKQAGHEDEKVAPLRAAIDAPAGKTPCETVYNSYVALDKAAKTANMPPPWKTLPEREVFTQACGALPPEAQDCLIAKNSGNREKCDPVIGKLKLDPLGQKFYALLGIELR